MASSRSYLLIHHIAKDSNVGALLRSANAFGVHEVVLVGRRRVATATAKGLAGRVKRVAFYTLPEAVSYLRQCGARILGVEIDPAAPGIEEHPFEGDTAFMLGNEGDGLGPAQRAVCDGLVRIRQHGHAPSLNVNVAGAIVLHHFGLWAGFEECPIEAAKFTRAFDLEP